MLRPNPSRPLLITALALIVLSATAELSAQTPNCAACSPIPGVDPTITADDGRDRGPWWTLWSRRTPHDRLVLGMLTSHVYSLADAQDNNWAFGIVHRGVLAATFITTHGPRGYVAAFERSLAEGRWGPTRTMLGFRAGLVYGYDRRLFQLAEWTPILPYGQPIALIRAGPVTFDLTYTWVVFSLTIGASVW